MSINVVTKSVKVEDKGFKKLSNEIKKAGYSLQVGFFEEDRYEDGTPVASVAAIQNYGAPAAGIPKRLFFNQAITKNARNWQRLTKKNLRNWLRLKSFNDLDAVALGAQAAGDLRREITTGNFTPNKPATVAAKGSSRPLIDSARMRNSAKSKLQSRRRSLVS